MKVSRIHRGRNLWKTIKMDCILLYRAVKHPKTHWGVKALIVGLVIYIISPIDLIPAWFIGFGVLDDVGLAVLVIGWVKKLIPRKLLEELEGKIIIGKE